MQPPPALAPLLRSKRREEATAAARGRWPRQLLPLYSGKASTCVCVCVHTATLHCPCTHDAVPYSHYSDSRPRNTPHTHTHCWTDPIFSKDGTTTIIGPTYSRANPSNELTVISWKASCHSSGGGCGGGGALVIMHHFIGMSCDEQIRRRRLLAPQSAFESPASRL